MSLIKNALPIVFVFFSITNLYAQPTDWDDKTPYNIGDLVVYDVSTYIAISDSTNQKPPNATYWTDLSVAASALGVPEEVVPTLPENVLNSLSALESPDGNTTGSYDSTLLGISTNAITYNAASVVAGITIAGGTKRVVFQVQGRPTYPSEASFLSDPRLSIYSGSTLIAQVDDWQAGPVDVNSTYYQASYLSDLSSSKYAMSGASEPAIILNLPVGSFTALVDGKGVEGKVVIGAFVFDSSTSSKLFGISTNAFTRNAASVVAGITITGGTKRVVFQVQGRPTYPSEASFLSDPRLSIYSGSTLIARVDDWQTGPVDVNSSYYQASYLSDLSASKYAMSGASEPAIILNLPVGSYTALVDGKGVEGKVVIGAFDLD